MASISPKILSPILNNESRSRTPKLPHSKTPCISLKKINSTDNLMTTSSPPHHTGIALRPVNSLISPKGASPTTPSTKLPGSPGYVFFDPEYQSPVKVHPTNPRHVRGGSISSDLDDIPSAEQIIPMQPCEEAMLVPLLHRHQEMKQLISANPVQFVRLQSSLSQQVYNELLHLWTEVTRADMGDNDWLVKTRKLLEGRSSPNWSMWCDMVGFCEQAHPLVSGPPSPAASSPRIPATSLLHERRSSATSLFDETIHEEEEES